MVEGATGELVGAEPLDPAYWRRQAESPVLFARALASLDDELGAVRPDGPRVFVEVGPRPVLLGLARRSLEGTGREFIASLRPDGGAWAPLLDAAMRLHLLGVPIDWHGFDADYHRTVVALPSYPFERTRHWILEAQGAEKHPAPAVQPPAAVPVASAVPDPPARDELLAGGPAERRELLETYLQAALAAVLGVPSSTLDVGQPIADSGLDSIMVLDVRHRVERALSVPLPVVSIAEGATIAELADRLAQLLEGSGQAAPELAR
jgi:acyl transferase domain-containing protein